MTSKNKDIKLCLFDCGGVVYPYDLSFFYDCLNENKTNIDKPHLLWKELMQGDISVSDFYKDVCQKYGCVYNEKQAEILTKALLKGVGSVYLETLEVMRFLKAKNVKIGLLSNALPQLEKTINTLPLDKEFVFPSYVLRSLKPDIEIFKKVQEKIKIPFENILFIDDKIENVKIAQQLGIKSLVYQRKKVLNKVKCLMGEKNVRYSCDWRCHC